MNNSIIDQQKESWQEGFHRGLITAYNLAKSNQLGELERLINDSNESNTNKTNL